MNLESITSPDFRGVVFVSICFEDCDFARHSFWLGVPKDSSLDSHNGWLEEVDAFNFFHPPRDAAAI